jgi:hypothetical protein
MTATPHPELLPALNSAIRLEALLQGHPEVENLYCEFYGADLKAQINRISHNISLGNIDAPRLIRQLRTMERRVSRLATPAGNWN